MNIKDQLRKNKFIKNNGAVIRAINLLRTDYVNLVDVTAALEPQIAENEALDSLNSTACSERIFTSRIYPPSSR